jgi:stage II sporulation protein D
MSRSCKENSSAASSKNWQIPVAKRSKRLGLIVAGSLGCFFFSCASLPLLVPNPPSAQKKETGTPEVPTVKHDRKPAHQNQTGSDKRQPGAENVNSKPDGEVDFALALLDSQAREVPSTPVSREQTEKEMVAPLESKTVQPVSGRRIRVALRQNCAKIMLYAMDTMKINSPSLSKDPWFRGRMTVTAEGRGIVSVAIGNEAAREVALPCTLSAVDESALVDLGQESYRGSIIINGNKKFSVINYLDVEDYLRGVLPLEMGNQGKAATEALKAQAITARTYAYRRIAAHTAEPFDLVSTIADQVYGGADVETGESDAAVRSTSDLVLVWHDTLADVYYHSTCGGMTASIDEVWGRSPCEYLISVPDTAPDGTAWCSASKYFTWEETWSLDRLSKILRSTVKKHYPEETFTGVLEDITVYSRFGCGRIKACTLKGSDGSVACGGDKLRFVLRRKSASGSILRSANFSVAKNGPDEFVLKGRGYGHGVGLCQMGAIGRATAGQSFLQILAVYFKNTEIRKATVDGELR